jgi:dihydroflavonol-4-reductase
VKVFVTGGNGFIGSVVVRDLVTSGHDVVCLLRGASRTERIDDLAFARATGDVCDLESIRTAMRGCTCTIHLAAPGGWGEDEPSALHRIIEGGTRNVLQVAGELRDHRIVIVSSTAAINASDRPHVFDERAPFTLRDASLHYAHAKHQAELLAAIAYARGVPVVIANPAEVYGPNDIALGTAGNLVDFATSRPVLVCRGGTSVVHVADVSTGIIAALRRGRPGERYILSGENLTIRQLAQLVLELVGRHTPIVSIPRGVARVVSRIAARLRIPLPYNSHVIPYATRYWFVDSTKARRELGVSFRNARETIRSTVEWLTHAGFLDDAPRRANGMPHAQERA